MNLHNTWPLLIFLLIYSATAFALLRSGLRKHQIIKRLRLNGVRGKARVQEITFMPPDHLEVEVAMVKADKSILTATLHLYSELYSQGVCPFGEGENIAVIYNPENPQEILWDDPNYRTALLIYIIVVLLYIPVIIALIAL